MTIALMQQIQSAERGLAVTDATADPRFVPAPGPLRELSATILRATSRGGLRLADRLEGAYHAA
jgi:hypothetical protein